MIFHKSKGSEIIESAIVLPITITIVFCMLSMGIRFMQESKNKSLEYTNSHDSIINPSFSPEDYYRFKWAKINDKKIEEN